MGKYEAGSVLFAKIPGKALPRVVLLISEGRDGIYKAIALRNESPPTMDSVKQALKWALIGLSNGKLSKAQRVEIRKEDFVRTLTSLTEDEYAKVLAAVPER